MRSLIAWRSIAKDRDALNLDAFQSRQAESQSKSWDNTVASRIQETWAWAMAPYQSDPQKPDIEWSFQRLSGQDSLAARAGKRFQADEAILTQLGSKRLRSALDEFDLWRGSPHTEVKQTASDFATYLYLPRLRDLRLIDEAIRADLGQLVYNQLAYADSLDEPTGRYDGLITPGNTNAVVEPSGLIVKAEVAARQVPIEKPPAETSPAPSADRDPCSPCATPVRRFFGTVEVDPLRAGRDAGRIAEEILQHLATLRGAKVRMTIEIDADFPDGVSEDIQRVVGENCRVLKFANHGFERN